MPASLKAGLSCRGLNLASTLALKAASTTCSAACEKTEGLLCAIGEYFSVKASTFDGLRGLAALARRFSSVATAATYSIPL